MSTAVVSRLRLALALAAALCLFAVSALSAQTMHLFAAASAAPACVASEESSSALPKAPSAALRPVPAQRLERSRLRPFGAVAVALKAGTGGLGMEVATPLTAWANLRGSVQMFDHAATFPIDGLQSSGDITLTNIAASVDIYPFHGAFRISPGVTVHNDNHYRTDLLAPGGAAFSLGDANYTSDPADPVHGVARLRFGSTIAPRLTLGWGNMLKPTGGHWSMPFEVGFQYVTPPTIELALYGSACDAQGNCAGIDGAEGIANMTAEVKQVEQTLAPLRFYPIVSTGIGYRFGRGVSALR